nr:hypothetical protein [Tanacetum cinerariifolium]
MTWHATGKCTEPGKMQHPVDGKAWKDFDTKYSDFAAEPRNVRLGLAADSFNPFSNLSQSYSIWPVILTTYNLPPWLCMKESYFMLTLLIPGPKSPGKDIDVYLRPLIDDLKVLWAKPGVETIDVATGLKFNMRAMVLWTINDFPARSSLSGWSGQDTTKARQDLERLGIRSGLWLDQNKNRKCSKPQAAHSFTPEDRKSFEYLALNVAKPLIELCLFFKQICSQTLMVDDMLKAQSKVIDILCNLKLMYPSAFFDIMIHLVIHLPLDAIFGGPIRPQWMYPFERYMKKLKNYIQNKAKPEGSIAKGYVAEEALTFSSHYFRDVTTKFNRPDRNVDCPPPTCQLQVFKSLCKSLGLRSVIRIDHQELKKVIWYVLHNSPEIDTYRAKFKIEFPNKDMKEESPGWFGKQTPISVNSCVVNGVRFVVHSRDERRTTQNSGICSPGPDGEMYYGQLEQILEFSYLSFKNVLFQVKWFNTSNKGQDDPDVIHVDNSYDLALSNSLNDLEIAALHIDGQSIDVDAPPDIIDVVDEDDDIIDEEDPIPHDLVDSDDEDLVNLDIDDGVNVVYSSEEED